MRFGYQTNNIQGIAVAICRLRVGRFNLKVRLGFLRNNSDQPIILWDGNTINVKPFGVPPPESLVVIFMSPDTGPRILGVPNTPWLGYSGPKAGQLASNIEWLKYYKFDTKGWD